MASPGRPVRAATTTRLAGSLIVLLASADPNDVPSLTVSAVRSIACWGSEGGRLSLHCARCGPVCIGFVPARTQPGPEPPPFLLRRARVGLFPVAGHPLRRGPFHVKHLGLGACPDLARVHPTGGSLGRTGALRRRLCCRLILAFSDFRSEGPAACSGGHRLSRSVRVSPTQRPTSSTTRIRHSRHSTARSSLGRVMRRCARHGRQLRRRWTDVPIG